MEKFYETKKTFMHLGVGESASYRLPPAIMYEPIERSEKSQICVLLMHFSGDYLEFTPAIEISKRGYCVLAANTVSSSLEAKMNDVKLAMKYLREHRPDIKKIVLFGHSGGSTLLSCYQAIAENGVGVFQNSGMLYKFPDMETPPAADGVIMADANYGNSIMTLLSVDPAITDETSGMSIDPAFDVYNPANGFDPNGSKYDWEFIHKIQKAQGERMNRLVYTALDRLDAIEHGYGKYRDDEPFIVPGGMLIVTNNKLITQDVRLMSRTSGEYDLLHGDGSVTKQIVPSVRKAMFNNSVVSYYRQAALISTVRQFLSTFAILTDNFSYDESTISGVDLDGVFNSPISNMKHVSAPLLAMGMTGGYESMAAEFIYNSSKADDKSIAFVEGANHVYQTAKACEKYEGQFGDTVKTLFDHVDKWLSESGRFIG